MKIGIRHRRRGFLDKMLTAKRAEVARMLAGPPLPPKRRPGVDTAGALARPGGAPLRLIAAVSPEPCAPEPGPALAYARSAPAYTHSALAYAHSALVYARGGARALLAPIDELFLGGSSGAFAQCRDALDAEFGDRRPPLIADDFCIHPVQLDRAIDAGADAVRLIARILSGDALRALVDAARERGLEPIVEVDGEETINAALLAGARLLGVSGRDLNTGHRDDERAEAILRAASGRAASVILSELTTPEGVAAAAEGPACAALVAMAEPSPCDASTQLAHFVAMARAAEAGGVRA